MLRPKALDSLFAGAFQLRKGAVVNPIRVFHSATFKPSPYTNKGLSTALPKSRCRVIHNSKRGRVFKLWV